MSFRSMPTLLLAAPVLLLGLLAGCDTHNAANEQAAAPAPAVAGSAMPEGGAIDRSHKGEAAPKLSFLDPADKPTTLASFTGKPVLVNLWATWCGPCIKELPTLDAAAATITVATISQDKDRATVATFLAAHPYPRLKAYLDKDTGLSLAFNASLPMSVLYDSTGHEVWRTMGGMDWTSTKAKALLAEAT
jgi:thiol-disulfide isomerase/thioredoxin